MEMINKDRMFAFEDLLVWQKSIHNAAHELTNSTAKVLKNSRTDELTSLRTDELKS